MGILRDTTALIAGFVAAIFVVTLMLTVAAAFGQEYVPTLAAAGGYAVVEKPTPGPTPPPGPGPRECHVCDGRGWNGDGTVKISCNTCGGDGVLDGQQDAASSAGESSHVVSAPANDPQGQDAPPLSRSETTPADAEVAPPSIDPAQPGSLFDAPTLAGELRVIEAMQSGKRVVLVFHWPSETKRAKAGLLKVQRDYPHLAWVRLCLTDKWAGDTLVGQHWRVSSFSVWEFAESGLTPIQSEKQLGAMP